MSRPSVESVRLGRRTSGTRGVGCLVPQQGSSQPQTERGPFQEATIAATRRFDSPLLITAQRGSPPPNHPLPPPPALVGRLPGPGLFRGRSSLPLPLPLPLPLSLSLSLPPSPQPWI